MGSTRKIATSWGGVWTRAGSPGGAIGAPAAERAEVFQKTESARLRTWVGAGGSPQSVVRIARYSLPLMLAIIGGAARPLPPSIELYQHVGEQLGTTPPPRRVDSPGSSAPPTREPTKCYSR